MWTREAEEGGGENPRCRANIDRDQQQQAPPLFVNSANSANSDDAQANSIHWRNDQMDTRSAPIVSQDASHDNRPAAATAAPNRSGGDRNWSTRIRASIARLMEIDGISLDPERYAKLTEEKRAAKEAERTFLERVDRLQAASEAAHREHCERLRDVYPASTAKKMRLATVDQPSSSGVASIPPSMPPAPCHPRHEALDALAVAAATEEFNESGATIRPTTSKGKRPNRRQTLLHLEDGAGTEQNPVRIHDPQLAKAVNKLADKLAQLLGQLQATSDEATAEPILAAAAAVALEATEMRRNEEVALARMVEIEEHRQRIMEGLLEYEMRKEQWGKDESSEECTDNSSSLRDSMQDSSLG